MHITITDSGRNQAEGDSYCKGREHLVVELGKRCKVIGSLVGVDFDTFQQVVVGCIAGRKEVVDKPAGQNMELAHKGSSFLEEAAFHSPFLLKIQQELALLDQSRKICDFS